MSFRTGQRGDGSSYHYPVSATGPYVPSNMEIYKVAHRDMVQEAMAQGFLDAYNGKEINIPDRYTEEEEDAYEQGYEQGEEQYEFEEDEVEEHLEDLEDGEYFGMDSPANEVNIVEDEDVEEDIKAKTLSSSLGGDYTLSKATEALKKRVEKKRAVNSVGVVRGSTKSAMNKPIREVSRKEVKNTGLAMTSLFGE